MVALVDPSFTTVAALVKEAFVALMKLLKNPLRGCSEMESLSCDSENGVTTERNIQFRSLKERSYEG